MTPHTKSILATILLGLAMLQFVSIGINRRWFGKFTPHLRRQAVLWHRVEGYAAAGLVLFITYFCVQLLGNGGNGGGGPRVFIHSLLGVTVIGLAISKIAIKRKFRRQSRRLPLLGTLLFIAVIAIWISSAGWYFYTDGSY